MSNQFVKNIIADIGAYFGIRGSDAYLASLLGEKTDSPWPIDSAGAKEPFARGVLLNSICTMGDTSAPTTKALQAYIAETGEDFFEDVCITPNDSSYSGDGPVNALPCGPFIEQGLGKPAGDFYTVDDIRVGKDEGATPVNVIQVFPGVSNIATADTDVAALFLNSIPPLEFSRAVPYLDVMVIGQVDDDPSQTRKMSLGRWLLGRENPDGDIGNALFNSEDLTLNPVDDFQAGEKKTAFRTLANMEIFTSPATLTNADQYFGLSEKSLLTSDASDPFRPFLSIEKFKVQIQGSGIGIFSFKTAELSLVLHDKSKMKDIGPLVSPRQTGGARFVITYGWSHPDGVGKYGNIKGTRSSDADSNRFGELIDAMRVTETFQIYTSNYSFEEDGSVNIDVRLGLMGAENVDKIDVTLPKVASLNKELQKKFEQVKASINSYRASAAELGDVEMPQHISQVTNMNSAMNMETKEFKELLKDLRARKGDGDMSNVESITTYLMGKDGKGGALANLKNLKESALNKMIAEIEATPDPFMRWIPFAVQAINPGEKKGSNAYVDFNSDRDAQKSTADGDLSITNKMQLRHVTFGKLVTKFVGDALAREGIYEEVQIIFHPLNESAGFYHGQNIASIPIEISDLQKVLVAKFDNRGTMNLQQFMGLLARFFIRDPGAPAYGFRSAFGERDPEKGLQKKKLMAKNKKKGKKDDKKSHPILNDIRQDILKMCYLGPTDYANDKSAEGDIFFRMPSLSARLNTMPARNAVIETTENGPIPSKTILKMHIYDDAQNKSETLQDTFVAFAQSGIVNRKTRKYSTNFAPDGKCRWARTEEIIANQFSALEKRGIVKSVAGSIEGSKVAQGGHSEADLKEMAFGQYVIAPSTLQNMKAAIYKMSPTLIWGSMAGGLVSAKWQSIEAGGLQSVMMLRQADNEDGSDGRDGLPMQVSPTKVSLETMGCPYLGFTQQYFIDFGTNTTADNFYAITSVTHELSPGEYKTSAEGISMQAFGKLRSPKGALVETVLAAHVAKKKSG